MRNKLRSARVDLRGRHFSFEPLAESCSISLHELTLFGAKVMRRCFINLIKILSYVNADFFSRLFYPRNGASSDTCQTRFQFQWVLRKWSCDCLDDGPANA